MKRVIIIFFFLNILAFFLFISGCAGGDKISEIPSTTTLTLSIPINSVESAISNQKAHYRIEFPLELQIYCNASDGQSREITISWDQLSDFGSIEDGNFLYQFTDLPPGDTVISMLVVDSNTTFPHTLYSSSAEVTLVAGETATVDLTLRIMDILIKDYFPLTDGTIITYECVENEKEYDEYGNLLEMETPTLTSEEANIFSSETGIEVFTNAVGMVERDNEPDPDVKEIIYFSYDNSGNLLYHGVYDYDYFNGTAPNGSHSDYKEEITKVVNGPVVIMPAEMKLSIPYSTSFSIEVTKTYYCNGNEVDSEKEQRKINVTFTFLDLKDYTTLSGEVIVDTPVMQRIWTVYDEHGNLLREEKALFCLAKNGGIVSEMEYSREYDYSYDLQKFYLSYEEYIKRDYLSSSGGGI